MKTKGQIEMLIQENRIKAALAAIEDAPARWRKYCKVAYLAAFVMV